MRIRSNHIQSVIDFFHSELAGLYDNEEIDRFVELCSEAYVGFTRLDLLNRRQETVNESDLLKFNFAVKDLKKGRPVQYVLGKAWFFDMELLVNEHVLIPRPETEELVMWIVGDHGAQKNSFSVLDIGTGSGCIPIALKKKLPQIHVYALDVSPGALEVAKQNAEAQNMPVQFIEADVLDEKIGERLPSCAVIVSNPPYIRESESAAMHTNVRDYEPHGALFVTDEDALVFYKAIGKLGQQKLKPGGHLYFEINEALGLEVCILLQQLGYSDVQLRKDMQGKERMVRGTR